MKRWSSWLAIILSFALLVGCSNAGNYVQDHYPLVDVQGEGKNVSKIYEVAGKDVPAVAKELAAEETPKETSKEDKDQMFLVYKDRLIHVQKNPANASNSLVEVSTIEYARNHYDSSFLQGYLTASVVHALFGGGGFFGGLFGGGWFTGGGPHNYKGYTSDPNVNQAPAGSSSSSGASKDKKPDTSDRSGSFNTKPSGSAGAGSGKSSSGSSGTFRTKSSGGSSGIRKSDGSTPSFKSKPSTGSRSGSFSRRR